MTKEYMKYIFFGTPQFAVTVLEKLISAGLTPVAVVTNPDRPAGREKILTPPPVRTFARTFVQKCEQPEELDASFAQQLESYNADVFVVAAYGKILPKWLIEMPPKGTIGVHPSLLPKYRGATPIQTAILNGDEETGVSLYVLDEKVDNGPILANFKFQISNFETYSSLSEKLAEEGGELLAEVLPKYVNGEIAPHPQNEKEATYTKKFTNEDGFVPYDEITMSQIDISKSVYIHQKIKALNPEPGVYTINPKGQRIKLLEADLVDGKLVIKKIQRAGRKPEKRTAMPF